MDQTFFSCCVVCVPRQATERTGSVTQTPARRRPGRVQCSTSTNAQRKHTKATTKKLRPATLYISVFSLLGSCRLCGTRHGRAALASGVQLQLRPVPWSPPRGRLRPPLAAAKLDRLRGARSLGDALAHRFVRRHGVGRARNTAARLARTARRLGAVGRAAARRGLCWGACGGAAASDTLVVGAGLGHARLVGLRLRLLNT